MSRVRELVEGRTEQTFVRDVLAPSLATHNVFVSPTMTGKPGHRGGVRPWAVVRRDILATLRQDAEVYCTTMFDYYGLPVDWPGQSRARRARSSQTKASAIEEAILSDVQQAQGRTFKPARFVPYIQMHEFEALLFSDPRVFAESLQRPGLRASLESIVTECVEPEEIDDDPRTAPSKRLRALVNGYQKVVHGIIAAKRIGLTTMRVQCPHFAKWLEALEHLGGR